jgi:DNA-binding HxlR family transcriptional regulator
MENQSEEIIVLGAIQGGAKQFDKIKKITQIEPEKLNQILQSLENNNLIRVETKKGFFGPKIEMFVTDKGKKIVEERINDLEQNWKQMTVLWKSKDKQKLQQYMDDNKSVLPMMMFFGIIDIMMFSTMIGFLGATMTDYMPAEQIPEGIDGGDSGDAAGMDDGGFDIDIGF